MKRVLLVLASCACGRIAFEPRSDSSTIFASDADEIPFDVPPGTVIRYSLADTYIREMETTPVGSSNSVQCGAAGATEMRCLLLLDLTGVSGPVAGATLRLYHTLTSGGSLPVSFDVYRLTQAWDEGTATWMRAAQGMSWTGGGVTAPTVYATTSITPGVWGYYDWNITVLVNEWLGGTPNFGLQLRYSVAPATPTFFALRSREYPARPPELLITP